MSKSAEMRKNAHGMVKHAIHELDGPQGSIPDYRAVRAFLHLVDGYLELADSYELLEEMERMQALNEREPTDGCGIHGPDATYVTRMESYCTCTDRHTEGEQP